MRDQWIALAVILVGYWAAFALYPLPGADFDYASVGVPADWLQEHVLTGFAAHWNKNSNLAWAFDTWFLNLFPAASTLSSTTAAATATLSFIPTLGTMILGLIAGGVLRSERTPWAKVALAGDGRRRRWSPAAGCWAGWASARWSSASGRQAGCSSAAAGASCCWPRSTR